MKSPQKIVNQVRDCLVGNPDIALLRSLSLEYAELVKIANARLEKCSIILDSGDEYQTLQMAEIYPPLLDLVAILGFQGYNEWKLLCQQRGLTVPERLNEKEIARLNALYHKGLSPTHPYYKAYRTAMFEKDEEKALSVLFTISRLNSSDSVAKNDLDRLQHRVLEKKLASLRSAIQSGNRAEIARVVDEIERIDPRHECKDEALEQSQHLFLEYQKNLAEQECEEILARLKQDFPSENLSGAKELLDQFSAQRNFYQISMSPAEESEIADENSWFGELKKAIARQESEVAAQMRVKKWLDEHEYLLKSLPSLSRSQLGDFGKESSGQLSKLTAPPAGLKSRIDAFLKSFDLEMEKRNRKLQRKLFLLAAVTTGVFLLISWGYWKYAVRQQSLSLLSEYQKSRRVADSLQVLNKLGKPSFFNNPFLSAEDVRPYVAWTREAKAEGEQALYLANQFSSSARQKFSDKSLGEHMGLYKQISDYTQSLPTEYSLAVSETIKKYEPDWQEYLQSERSKFDKTFSDMLAKAESVASSNLNYSFPPEKIRESIPTLQKYEQQLTAMLENPNMQEILPVSSAERLNAIRVRIASFTLEIDTYRDAIASLRNTPNEKNFFNALNFFSNSRLVSTMEVRAAREITKNHQAKISNFLQYLFMPDNPEGWRLLSSGKKIHPIPEDALPDEISNLVNLRDSQELRNIWKYEIRSYQKKKLIDQPDDVRFLYSLGAIPKPKKKTDLSSGDQNDVSVEYSGQFYDPRAHPDNASFIKRTFIGSRNQKQNIAMGDFLENETMTVESQMFLKLGLDDFYSGESKSFKLSLFTVLDRLRSNKDANPLFKAYIHYALVSTTDSRPFEWSLYLAPAVSQHIKTLQEILRPLPAAGDWMVPRRRSQFEAKLTQFYNQTSQPSYETQFKLHSTLFQEAIQSGLLFGGYIGADGDPVLLPEAIVSREVWGLSKSGQVTLLLRSDDGKSAPRLVQEAMPFSPLYVGKADRSIIKKKAFESLGLALHDKNYESYLPSYFQDTP